MWIDRICTKPIQRMFRGFPAVLVTGPRQVGKTSLLKHLFPDMHYFSFDDLSLARQTEENPREFFSALKEPVLFDEIQYVPSFLRFLKTKIDEDRKPGRFLLTGSQIFPLMQGVSESLAGRCGMVEMHSLSLSEVRHTFLDFAESDFIVRGGFPELYGHAIEKTSDWYASYVTTYLERDVRNLKQVGDLRDFERLLRACALRTGQLLSYSDLARDVGISPNTAKQWISVLVASGQIFLLEPYHRSLGKRLVKSPKIYFLDTGLACHLVGLQQWSQLMASPLSGALWETHIVGAIVRHFHGRGEKPPLWFWRTNYGDEVDLLVEQGGRFIGIECKLSENPTEADLSGFKKLESFYGKNSLEKGFVACRTSHPFQFSSMPIRAVSGAPVLD